MEENLAADDVEIELAPIAVQIAYVQQILGNTQEAVASYTDFVKRNLADDESSLEVAVNNLIALKGSKDVSDGLRKLDKLIEKSDGPEKFQLARGLDLKLSQKQREAIYTNRVLLLLHSNKMDQARELVGALPGMFPGSLMPVLLQAAVHMREDKAAKVEEILGQYADKFPDRSKKADTALKEKNRASSVRISANIRRIKARLIEDVPKLQRLAVKKVCSLRFQLIYFSSDF
uniref:Signal recognition particle subunit srp72 n=1 Tax=Solanum tuberosum TaxID=4113 RepID=M1BIZ4_SOLTU